jgi:hypothetical protein
MSSSFDNIVSLGYRCSSAGILKRLGLKSASYPFDWLVSRLPIIEHCVVEDQFREFLNPLNYYKKKSATHHYANGVRQWICDENIVVNRYYENRDLLSMYISEPLHPDTDAYAHKLMMNHHDITTETDRAYYKRCISRWNYLFSSDSHRRILFLYIHPAMNYNCDKDAIIQEIVRFHTSIIPASSSGLYIIPVRTPFEYPTNHCCKYVLEEQPDLIPSCRICILWTNKDFVDAGEIFMGNCSTEEYVVKEYVQNITNLGHFP